MTPRFNVYKIIENRDYDGWNSKTIHTLEFLKSCHDLKSAEHWLSGNYIKCISYTIIPEYYYTDCDD